MVRGGDATPCCVLREANALKFYSLRHRARGYTTSTLKSLDLLNAAANTLETRQVYSGGAFRGASLARDTSLWEGGALGGIRLLGFTSHKHL